MRPIKFRIRIGDKVVGYERWNTSNPLERGNRWVYSKDSNPEFPKQWSIISIPHTDKDQFTGRSAKNGEVYEKDIVKAGDKDENTGVVIFQDGCWYLEVLEKYRHPAKVSRTCLHLIIPELEIIGNMFQNKDLLEKKT